MDFDHDNVRLVVTEDRLSSLPDELIHHILSCLDTKFAVQTCLLSRRWKFLWRSMSCLNFASYRFKNIPKFSKFVTNLLSRRNRQTEVLSVKLDFSGSANHLSVRKIANYAFSHNVQELTIASWPKDNREFPDCFFSSQSLKHLTFSTSICAPCLTPKTPWDFPALTTLHLNDIKLCDTDTRESVDLFSKCVNLKNLTLKSFTAYVKAGFNIITPRLSTLMLIHGRCSSVVNVIAPQLENLTVIYCSIKYLNAPPGMSSFCYSDQHPPKVPKDCFHCINKVTLTLNVSQRNKPYKEDDAREAVNFLQELGSAKFLTLNLDIVECLSSFPDLVSHHPSPFSNLVSFKIDSSREEPYKVKFSAEARNFLLENSPTAMLIMDLPKEPLTKARKAKEARERKKALIANIESQMSILQASLEQENILLVERKQARGTTKAALENLMAEQEVWAEKRMMQIDPMQPQDSVENFRQELTVLMTQIMARLVELRNLDKQEIHSIVPIVSRKERVVLLLDNVPKRQREVMEARYSPQFEQIKTLNDHLSSTLEEISFYLKKITDALGKIGSANCSTFQDVSSSELPLPSQPSSSPSAIIPTPSTSSINLSSEPPAQDAKEGAKLQT